MSEGPTRKEIDRVREALDHHDSDLREEDEKRDDEPEETSEEQDEDR